MATIQLSQDVMDRKYGVRKSRNPKKVIDSQGFRP